MIAAEVEEVVDLIVDCRRSGPTQATRLLCGPQRGRWVGPWKQDCSTSEAEGSFACSDQRSAGRTPGGARFLLRGLVGDLRGFVVDHGHQAGHGTVEDPVAVPDGNSILVHVLDPAIDCAAAA